LIPLARKKDKKYESAVRLNYILSTVVIALFLLLLYKFGAFSLFSPNYGKTLAGIDTQFSMQQLSVINNAPPSYFEKAGEMLLNGSLNDEVIYAVPSQNLGNPPFIVDGKPSVIYLGAISCLWCGENRWAMALALSRFGNFTSLYNGYSSIGDEDLPTIYWQKLNYTANGTNDGNSFSGKYINFISSEYESNISKGFLLPNNGIPYFIQQAPNKTYASAISFLNGTNLFEGTPFTYWGNVVVTGADAVVFGNTPPTNSTLPLQMMTHSDVLDQLGSFNDQFSWAEYAAADVYVSYVCPSINDTAPVCNLPAIRALDVKEGLA
jgi:hypothetical protein